MAEEYKHPNFDESDSRLDKDEARNKLAEKDKGVNSGISQDEEDQSSQIKDETYSQQDTETNEEVSQQPVELNETEQEVVDRSKAGHDSLGEVTTFSGFNGGSGGEKESEISGANDETWKPLNIELLPTQGLFLPKDVEINIRSAMNREIRQWSIIDENDPNDAEEKINFILERCVKIRSGNRRLSWKDITDFDRLFIIYRIKELTFPNGENEISIKFQCPGTCQEPENYSEKTPLTSGMLAHTFKIPEELMKYYDPDQRKFIAKRTDGNEIHWTLPSVGVSAKLRKSITDGYRNGEKVDKEFYRYAPYMIEEWRDLNEDKMNEVKKHISRMDYKEQMFRIKVTDLIEDGVNSDVNKPCPHCDKNLTAPAFFRSREQGGISLKDLFVIPDTGLDDLL